MTTNRTDCPPTRYRMWPLALVAMLSLSLLAAHNGDPIIVNDGADDPGVADCEVAADAHFTSVQAAEDHATPGDTIIVCPGIYSENVWVSTSDLDIIGRDGAIMDGSALAPDDSRGAFILEDRTEATDPGALWVKKVLIEGFEIRNYTNSNDGSQDNGIRAFENTTSEITIRNNYIHDNGLIGIWTGYGDPPDEFVSHNKWIVENNRVDDHGFSGIYLANCSDCKVRDNAVARTSLHGIRILALRGFDIEKVYVERNVVDTAGRGIYLHTSSALGGAPTLSDVEVKENTVTGTSVAGIEVRADGDSGIDDVKVEKNIVTGNGALGVHIIGGDFGGATGVVTKVSVRENTIDDAGSNGVTVDTATDVKVEKNRIGSAGGDGTELRDTTKATVKENVITAPGGRGADLMGVFDAKVEKNAISDTGTEGILLGYDSGAPAGMVVIKDNLVDNAGSGDTAVEGTGIRLSSSMGNVVEDNAITGSSHVGIRLDSSDGNTIKENATSESIAEGLLVDDESAGNKVEKNAFDVGTTGANGDVDARDHTASSPTANEYKDNKCEVSVPDGLCKGSTSLVSNQDFSTGTEGWSEGAPWGSIAASGGTANVEGTDGESAPYSFFDGPRDRWPGPWTAEIDVLLDPSWAIGEGFDYSVAAAGTDGAHQRDYIFHVGVHTDGRLLVNADNNSEFAVSDSKLAASPPAPYEVTTAGWYTLQHVFTDVGGTLSVDLNLLDADGNVLFTETRPGRASESMDQVGGNYYSWFTFVDVPGGITVDNHQLFLSAP
jgi:parallel beta-helix repeat protein